MQERSGSFPISFANTGLEEILKSLPEDTTINKIVDLGCGSGRVGLAVWEHYSNIDNIEPILCLVDIDQAWFEDRTERMNKDTFQKACRDYGLERPPDSISYIVSDINEYLKSTEDRFDLVLMRSVLQFIDRPIELLHNIKQVMTSSGVFLHACLTFPSQESKLFYDELTEYLLTTTKSRFKRKLHTLDEVLAMTGEHFSNVEKTAHYALRADLKYVVGRFGLLPEQSRVIGEEIVPYLLEKYPAAGTALNIETEETGFRIDVPYNVLRGSGVKRRY